MYYLFPIFLELKEWTLIEEWHKIFEDCALGKFPEEFTFKDGIITMKDGEEIEIKELMNKNPENYSFILFLKLTNILKNHSSSNNDSNNENIKNNWSSIKQKYTKSNLILDYVIKCKKEYNLDDQNTKILFANIKLGLVFKNLTAEDIVMKNGKIVEIKKIIIDNGKVIFDLFTADKKIIPKPYVDKKNQFIEKFLKEHKNYVIQYKNEL